MVDDVAGGNGRNLDQLTLSTLWSTVLQIRLLIRAS